MSDECQNTLPRLLLPKTRYRPNVNEENAGVSMEFLTTMSFKGYKKMLVKTFCVHCAAYEDDSSDPFMLTTICHLSFDHQNSGKLRTWLLDSVTGVVNTMT